MLLYAPTKRAARLTLATVLAASACSAETPPTPAPAAPAGPKYEPVLTAELVAPAAKGLLLGVATQKDVTAAFGAGELVKDRSLGGDAKVLYNEAPALHVALPAKDDVTQGEAWFVADAGGELRLHRLDLLLKTTDTCAWIGANVGKHEAAKRRPGSNRKFGARGDGFSYSAGTTDGATAIGIECEPSTQGGVKSESLSYSVQSPSGSSSIISRDP